jgi:hypothetical protein
MSLVDKDAARKAAWNAVMDVPDILETEPPRPMLADAAANAIAHIPERDKPDIPRAANAMCARILENVLDLDVHQHLCELHPSVWEEAAEVAIRAGRGEFDARPFTTRPDLRR